MSIVGPRPTLRYQVDRYTPHQRRRLEVKPGLTGWAQVNGRAELPWEERIELDVWYVEHRSARLDLRILLRTPRSLFRGTYKGAHGGWRHGSSRTARTSSAAAAHGFGQNELERLGGGVQRQRAQARAGALEVQPHPRRQTAPEEQARPVDVVGGGDDESERQPFAAAILFISRASPRVLKGSGRKQTTLKA